MNFELTLLADTVENSVFGRIDEIFTRTTQPTFRGEGFGQICLLPLMWQLTAPHGKSHLTFTYHGVFPKNHDIRNSEFFNTIGGKQTFAAPAKASSKNDKSGLLRYVYYRRRAARDA